MFIRLFDAKTCVAMLLSVKDIIAVKEYRLNDDERDPIANARSVIMTRPLGEDARKTHDYFVSETITDIETLITNSIELMY